MASPQAPRRRPRPAPGDHKPEPPNPVHMTAEPETRWSTVNFGEAIQGVQTPFSWAVWSQGMETATRKAFCALGIFSPAESAPPATSAGRISGIFYGRAAGNINVFRMVGSRIPGSSPDVLEEKLFGEVSGAAAWGEAGGLRRSATIAAKFPVAALRSPRIARRQLADQRRWWRRDVLDNPPATTAAAQQLVRAAADRFTQACIEHTTISMIGPQLLDALAGLAEQATGEATLGVDLATGYGGVEETDMIADLWAAARGRIDLREIRRRHGYHGPQESKLESRSWREDSEPLERLIDGYRARGLDDPRARERERIATREAAAARVLAGLPVWKRPAARFVMAAAASFIPGREVSKTSFLHALDGARCGARAVGRYWAEQGVLSAPEDVFFLTLDEVAGPPDPALADLAEQRKANHLRYLGLTLPPAWYGEPTPIPVQESRQHSAKTRIQGIGVVGSVATGRARVITDPTTAEMEPGDILVCATTDPSWTPLFMLSDALVIDTGGQMSHGAIVARELGVCCVINTVTGTVEIPDGATITVDGTACTVEIVGSDESARP
jgi:pyruvate,water dikinase